MFKAKEIRNFLLGALTKAHIQQST